MFHKNLTGVLSLRTISFKVTDELIKKIDELVEEGMFLNRSEAIRYAIRLLLEQQEKIKKKRVERIQL